MVMNQMNTMGPNRRPIFPVPRLCARKSPIKITMQIGSTRGPKRGSSTFKPSTAESTETAGVSMPSPKKRARPITANTEIADLSPRGNRGERCASAANASTPPSPLLSARKIKTTYFIVTMTISDHRISEMAPITATRIGRPPVASTDWRTAYSGLVPISP